MRANIAVNRFLHRVSRDIALQDSIFHCFKFAALAIGWATLLRR
jgi:hypothetical protein